MGKQKNKNSNDVYRGLKGWEKNYLKQAEKYGHIGDKKKYVAKEKR